MCFRSSLLQVTQGNASILKKHNTHPSQGHKSPQPLALPSFGEREYWKYALRNSGEEVGFSHFHPRLADVFLRESRAVQARSFHYHSEKALHETLPGKQRRLLIIFLLYYCQNLLHFTFCCWKPFFFYIPIAVILSPSHLNVEIFRAFCALSSYIYLLIRKRAVYESKCLKSSRSKCERFSTGAEWNQMPVFVSHEALALDLDPLSKGSQHAQHSSWDGNVPVETLAEQIWL